MIFGLLVFFFPLGGILTMLWLIAAYAIIFGILLIVLGFRLRGLNQRREAGGAATA